jgi:hypothetical protein
MFKDYQFFSNNLQDAARQILEAQEAQAKKENEPVEPGPNEPMGQPLDEPAYDPIPLANKAIPVNKTTNNNKENFTKLPRKNNIPDDDLVRIVKDQKAKFDEEEKVKNLQFRDDMIEKQRLARQKDQEEATRQGMTLENYYKIKMKDNERKGELEKKQEELIQNSRGVSMSDLA